MTRSRRSFASSPWIATGTPDYVNLGYTSRGLAKQALMRLSRKSLDIFRKLGLGAWDHWGKPMLVGDVDPSQGPVLVTVEYEVEPKKADEFLEALHKFARVRRRDGASTWGVYRDTEHPAHYVETFIVESWGSTCDSTSD